MKHFSITVNGTPYNVSVEEVAAGAVAAAPIAAAPKAAPVAAPKAAAPAPVAGGTPVEAQLPGTILDIKVAVGQEVKAGDCLLVLEAMKMENDIVSPSAGKVASINVNKGDSVNSGDVLVTLN